MIAGIFVEKLILSMQWLTVRQWSDWEILALSMAALLLLVYLTKLQRNKEFRKKYQDQFLEGTSYMGMSWGAHNKSYYLGKDLKKDRSAPVHIPQNTEHLQTKEPLEKQHKKIKMFHFYTNLYKPAKDCSEQQISESTTDNEKLHCELTKLAKAESRITERTIEHELLQETMKQLQNEITTHKQAKVSLEKQVSELAAVNEKLQYELTKLAKTESKIAEMTAEQGLLQETIKQLQNEITTHKQAKVSFEQQVSELTADNEKLQHTLIKFEQTESQNKQHVKTLEKLQEEIKQLQNEITTHKQAKVNFEQQVSELTTDNEKMQYELTKLAKAESKIAEMTAAFGQLQKEEPQAEQISEHQIVTELSVETPFRRKITKRNKIYEQQHQTVEGVRQKRCRKCKEWKPESEFHKNSSSKDNLAGSCKKCKNNEARERRRQR